MNVPALLAALFLVAAFGQTLPTEHGPLRNTFVVAAETVIDDSAAVDITAADANYDPLFAQLQNARTNLETMADGEREHNIANSSKDLVFLVTACHLQVRNGAPADKCLAQLNTARTRIMQQLNHHKSGNLWVEGQPPAR